MPLEGMDRIRNLKAYRIEILAQCEIGRFPTFGGHDYEVSLELGDNVVGDLRRLLLVLFASYDLDAQEHAATAHVANVIAERLQLLQFAEHVVTDQFGVLSQLLLLDHIEHRVRYRNRDRIASIGVEVFGFDLREALGDLLRCHHAGHRMAIADRFACFEVVDKKTKRRN